jgi:hypothetical protein
MVWLSIPKQWLPSGSELAAGARWRWTIERKEVAIG